MTRAEQIQAIVDDMDSWDLDTLVEWAKDQRALNMEEWTDEEVQNEYHWIIEG